MKARLSLRAMAPSTSKKNSGLLNPRWRVYRLFEEKIDKQQKILDSCFDRQQKIMDSYLDRRNRKLDEMTRGTSRRTASLEYDARQPRLAMEADGPANTKTRERTEGAVTAVQAMRGDSFSARRVEPVPKINSTSFGMMAESHALPCRDDVLVENGDASLKSCLPSLEMHSPTAAGGLVPTGEASTITETTVNEPLLQFCSTEEANCKKTSTPYVSFNSSVRDLLVAPSGLRVIEAKPMQNRTFDSSGFQGRLRACPVLGSWRALLGGEVARVGAAGDELQLFFGGDSLALLQQGRFQKYRARKSHVV